MCFVDDLMRGLVALQYATEEELKEPGRGYCIPGLSFSPNELFHEIRQHIPDFKARRVGCCHGLLLRARLAAAAAQLCSAPRSSRSAQFKVKTDPNMNKFAKLWPDVLSLKEPLRDLDYEPFVTMPRMVAQILNAHSSRKISGRAAFRSIDTCESGRINDYMLEKYVRKYLVRGRERFSMTVRRQDLVPEIVAHAMDAMDVDNDGKVSMEDFLAWSRENDVEGFVENTIDDYVLRDLGGRLSTVQA